MSTTDSKNDIEVIIDELIIDIDIKILLVLSNLAQIDQEYTAAPKPVMQTKEIINTIIINKIDVKE